MGGENWAQFELGEPKTEAATLAQLETSLHLKRGWNADAAANVYMRSKAALWAVGQDVAGCHRFLHRRCAREHCGERLGVRRRRRAERIMSYPREQHA
jgi:hypothetical protein